MGDENEVELHPHQWSQIGGRAAADLLRVEPAIDNEMKIPNLTVQAVSPDAPRTVQIDDLHVMGASQSAGIIMSNFGIRTKIRAPCASTP